MKLVKVTPRQKTAQIGAETFDLIIWKTPITSHCIVLPPPSPPPPPPPPSPPSPPPPLLAPALILPSRLLTYISLPFIFLTSSSRPTCDPLYLFPVISSPVLSLLSLTPCVPLTSASPPPSTFSFCYILTLLSAFHLSTVAKVPSTTVLFCCLLIESLSSCNESVRISLSTREPIDW